MLLLDEPTAGIDPVARRDLWDLLFALAAGGVALLVTTHYMDEAERCGELGYLFASRLIVSGTPSELKALPSIHRAGRARFAVTTSEPPRALAWIRRQPGCEAATLFGETVHALMSHGPTREELLARMIEEGFDRVVVDTFTPSLEDVFVELTGQFASAAT